MSSKDAKVSATSAIIVGVAIAVIPAVVGFILSFVDGIRKDKLAFTNNQIEKLYGPLHALAQANDATWSQFGVSERAPNWNNPSKEQITFWRVWMRNVLQPMNVKIEKTIVDNSQLVVGDEFPGAFRNIIAHTEAYNALISTWRESDIADLSRYTNKLENTVALVYPDDFDRCVGPIYTALKMRQEALQTHIFLYVISYVFSYFFETFPLVPVAIPSECSARSTAYSP